MEVLLQSHYHKRHSVGFPVFLTLFLRCSLCILLNWEGARLNNSIPNPISLPLLATMCSHCDSMNIGLTIWPTLASSCPVIFSCLSFQLQRTNLRSTMFIYFFFVPLWLWKMTMWLFLTWILQRRIWGYWGNCYQDNWLNRLMHPKATWML